MPGIFDEDVETEDSSTSMEMEIPGSRGDETNGDAGETGGGDKVSELERKLAEERGANEGLMVRLARLEGALSAAPAAAPKEETAGFTVEQLAEHASGGSKEAFEASIAYLKQESGNFREQVIGELKANQAKEDTRSEMESLLPGISTPGSDAYKAVEIEALKIQNRRPSFTPERAWDLATVTVAKNVVPGSPPEGAGSAVTYSRDRRMGMSAAAGAASGGDRDPGAPNAMEFTKEDEVIMRRMKPDSRLFSSDPKVRAVARSAFLKLKGNIADRSQPASYTRPQFSQRGQ